MASRWRTSLHIDNTRTFIVSTDLDGTLLDHHTYAWHAAIPAIEYLQSRNIPIVFNTSKTLAEAADLQSRIGISGPLIVENGSALACQEHDQELFLDSVKERDFVTSNGYLVINFGRDRSDILAFIKTQKIKYGEILQGYNDWPIETICAKTGLQEAEAKLSRDKNYSEPFIWLSDPDMLKAFIHNANTAGFKVLQGGRFFHLQGNTTKATPLIWMRQALAKSKKCRPPLLICLGDNKNDIDMLNIADYPVCVKSPISDYPTIVENPDTIYTQNFGPAGWNEAIDKLFATHEHNY